jgi:hypothetical protein
MCGENADRRLRGKTMQGIHIHHGHRISSDELLQLFAKLLF